MRKKLIVFLMCLLCTVSALWGCTQEAADRVNSFLGDESSQISTTESNKASTKGNNTTKSTKKQKTPTTAAAAIEKTVSDSTDTLADKAKKAESSVSKNKSYTAPEKVAAYIHLYGKLPKNFITKRDAQSLGWSSSSGNLQQVASGKSIGGDRFGNYEGLLPSGKSYKECDVNYNGGYRGAERLIYTADGSVYYTSDHYETFTQIY